MSDDWDEYVSTVEGLPAAMSLDLSFEEAIPSLPVMLFFTLYFKDPEKNGLAKPSEYNNLFAIEDALVEALTSKKCLFVGHCSCDGQRDFFFYLATEAGAEAKLEAVMAQFAEYDWDAGFTDEPDWETYFEFLYPDDQELDSMLNERIRTHLLENGDALDLPREIDHWMFFPSAQEREAIKPKLIGENFRLKDTSEAEKEFGLLAQRDDAPQGLDAVTWQLRELVAEHDGNYDGWGCTPEN